jgi:hypothetical protein
MFPVKGPVLMLDNFVLLVFAIAKSKLRKKSTFETRCAPVGLRASFSKG